MKYNEQQHDFEGFYTDFRAAILLAVDMETYRGQIEDFLTSVYSTGKGLKV